MKSFTKEFFKAMKYSWQDISLSFFILYCSVMLGYLSIKDMIDANHHNHWLWSISMVMSAVGAIVFLIVSVVFLKDGLKECYNTAKHNTRQRAVRVRIGNSDGDI